MKTTTAREAFAGPQKSTNVRASTWWMRTLFSTGSRWAPGPTAAVAADLFRATRRSKPRPGERAVLEGARPSKVAAMQVWSWGEGPPVLLVHGWNGRGTQLGAFVAPLVARGYRVVMFDAFGHGNSEGNRSSLPELAANIHQLVEELGGVYAIIAHSLGGAATTFALARGMPVERAVFVSPPSDPREYLKAFTSALQIDEPLRERVKQRIERRVGVTMEALHVTAIAPSMQVPLMVIHDEDDKEVPVAAAHSIAAAWPTAELVITKGLGHQRILRDQHVRDVAVRFVDRCGHLRSAA